MAPARLIEPYPEVQMARRRAYELDVFTGGSCMGNLDAAGRPTRAINFLKQMEEDPQPNVRNFADARPEIQKLIDPFYAAAKL